MEDIKYFKNNIPADIYIGQGAGKKLLSDIENAKKSIKIVSPYLSPTLIEKLIDLKNRGIAILLITSDEIEDYKGFSTPKIIYKLIKQIKHLDEKAQIIRNKIMKIKNWLSILLLINILLSLFLIIGYSRLYWPLIGLSMVFIISIIILIRKIKNKRIFNYSYEQFFPFRVYISPFNPQAKYLSNNYIHSKIYIIDDEIAYLGSLNYTKSGTENNFESRIRIVDNSTVIGLSNLVDNLFYNNDKNLYVDIQIWGKEIYGEPIN